MSNYVTKSINGDIFQYYIDTYAGLNQADTNLKLFSNTHERILCHIYFNPSIITPDINADILEGHKSTLVLTDSWFLFESLNSLIKFYEYIKPKPSSSSTHKTSYATYDDAYLEPKNYNYTRIPYGPPEIFDYTSIKNAYLEYLLDSLLEEYEKNMRSIFDLRKSQDELLEYFMYLEKFAYQSQREYLLTAYNQIFQNFNIFPQYPLSISYAIRNQYVHNGEPASTGFSTPFLKTQFINAHHKFVLNYSLIVVTELIENEINLRNKNNLPSC